MIYSSTHTTNKDTNNNFAGTNACRTMPAVPVLQKVESEEDSLQMKPNNSDKQIKERVTANVGKGLESEANMMGEKALQMKENTSGEVNHSVAQKKSNVIQRFRFVDKRSDTILQRARTRLRNLKRTAHLKPKVGSWKSHYMKKGPWGKCCVKGCRRPAAVGAHVEIATKKTHTNNRWIAPFCQKHNMMNTTAKMLEMKPGTLLVSVGPNSKVHISEK